MSSAVAPEFTNQMLDENFRYIANVLNRHHAHIKHLEGHIVEITKQLDDTTKATVILSKQALRKRNRKVLLIAGVAVGYYLYKKHKVEVVLENPKTGEQHRYVKPQQEATWTSTTSEADADAPDTTL